MTIRRPPKLETGHHVRVLSPSGPVTEDLLRSGVDRLESWGLEVSVDDHAYRRDLYLAGSDEIRAEAVNRALRDPDVDAVIFSRGGYGAMRILDAIDWDSLRSTPRILCGFSDITALHLATLRNAELATLHGPVVKSFDLQSGDLDALRAQLFGQATAGTHEVQSIRPGRASGPAIGGNLSLVAAMLGSRHLPSLRGAVLFLEDVGEADYRLDRLFTSLRLAGALEGVAAIVLGDFVDCGGVFVKDADIPEFVDRLGRELGDSLDVPVVSRFPFGHGHRNVTIPHGVRVEVDADHGRVTFLEESTA